MSTHAWMEKLPERIRSKIAPPDANGCMRWLGIGRNNKYGVAQMPDGTTSTAHRVVYSIAREPVPKGMHVDHICRVRDCVNVEHLEVVTPAENTRRGLRGVLNPYREVCRNGHSMADAYVNGRSRGCRTCAREREAARVARIRARRAA